MNNANTNDVTLSSGDVIRFRSEFKGKDFRKLMGLIMPKSGGLDSLQEGVPMNELVQSLPDILDLVIAGKVNGEKVEVVDVTYFDELPIPDYLLIQEKAFTTLGTIADSKK